MCDKKCIMQTSPCNDHHLISYFCICSETRVYRGIHFFLIVLSNIDCGYSLEPPQLGGSNVYPQSMFRAKIRKKSQLFI